MAHDLDPASDAGLVSLLGGLITDTKQLLVHELELAKLEVRQEAREAKRAILTLGGGVGAAVVTRGLLLIVMLVHLLEAVTGLLLWGCYGLMGGAFALVGAIFLTRGKPKPGRGKGKSVPIFVFLPCSAQWNIS